MNRIAFATLSLIAYKATATTEKETYTTGDQSYTERMPERVGYAVPKEDFPDRCELSGVKVCTHSDFTYAMVMAELQFKNCEAVAIQTNSPVTMENCESAEFDSKVSQIQGFRTKKDGTHFPVVSGVEFTTQTGRKYAMGDTEERTFESINGKSRTIVADEMAPVSGWINGMIYDRVGLLNMLEFEIVSPAAQLDAKEQWIESTAPAVEPETDESSEVDSEPTPKPEEVVETEKPTSEPTLKPEEAAEKPEPAEESIEKVDEIQAEEAAPKIDSTSMLSTDILSLKEDEKQNKEEKKEESSNLVLILIASLIPALLVGVVGPIVYCRYRNKKLADKEAGVITQGVGRDLTVHSTSRVSG